MAKKWTREKIYCQETADANRLLHKLDRAVKVEDSETANKLFNKYINKDFNHG